MCNLCLFSIFFEVWFKLEFCKETCTYIFWFCSFEKKLIALNWSKSNNGVRCVKDVCIRSYFCIFLHSDWTRRDTEYLSVFSPNAGKSGENADQNNFKYEHFLCSRVSSKIKATSQNFFHIINEIRDLKVTFSVKTNNCSNCILNFLLLLKKIGR